MAKSSARRRTRVDFWEVGHTCLRAYHGFDHWVGFSGQGTYFDPVLNVDGERVKRQGFTTDLLTQYAVDLLNLPRTKPLCLWLPHKAVHPELQQFTDGSISDPNGGEFVPAERHKSLFVGAPVVRRPNATKAPSGSLLTAVD